MSVPRGPTHRLVLAGLLVQAAACGSAEPPPPPPHDGVHSFANGCYALAVSPPGRSRTRWLAATEAGDAFTPTQRDEARAARLFLRPSDLATYLLYDTERRYVVAGDDGELLAQTALSSDVLEVDDAYVSGAEWELEVSAHDPARLQLRNRRTGRYLSTTGADAEGPATAAVIALHPRSDCVEPPELSLDAEGEVEPRSFDDGDVYGIVDSHSHLFSNFGFGGGGVFHGSPFHRLGVEHALPDCALFHGADGRRDLFGFASRGGDLDGDALLTVAVTGRTPGFDHHTEGYPEFTDWPTRRSETHQTQYWRWLQRAWLAGLRLVVQHGTSNEVICQLLTGLRAQRVRYSCNDMVGIERQIEETYALERYVDAWEGGPGRGWFRVVTSPAQAREVIREGKLAVVLGIEVSNLFDCFVTPREGFPVCDEARVVEQLDRFHALGVRVLFPNHKYDNAFSAGDGHRAFIELGNFINSGHYSNFTEECPDIRSVFDRGGVQFGGLNRPRDDYDAPPAVDTTGFADDPIGTVTPFLSELMEPPLEGDFCQNAGLTPLGEHLLHEMMVRGMIPEIDHLPRRAYVRAFEILEENDYPASGSHGMHNEGRLYELGGVANIGIGRCGDPDVPGTMIRGLRDRVELIREHGGYPAEGFAFDLNGLAGVPRPRFGDDAGCDRPQANPVEYPFTSYAGDVTFHAPRLGHREVDFNTEGMVHIGLMPELIEDARRDGATDEDLEPLFRSAEAYLRMWERAEERAAALR